MKSLLIGTNNQGKIEHMKTLLPKIHFVTPKELNIALNIEEGTTSLVENALLKARTYAEHSNLTSISADVGLFIPSIGGEPGVAGRRWGGELPESVSDEEWLDYLQYKLRGKEKVEAYFNFTVAIATPKNIFSFLSHHFRGQIDITIRSDQYTPGYPAGSVFISEGFSKPWNQLSEEEALRRDTPLRRNLLKVLRELNISTTQKD